ncbi:unnamed protein product [Rhizophagus irregularis]|uniref:Uncharacterized protein n=1 Tax=Rhizophagus irregularis TaxID=588596 RepID=A0A916E7E2_9GLOM|nr:unnamed protein product [Rhizophagus irregularis]CAB5360420.1 unnamed protein product [Rhizophagus irregularis]
MIPILSHKDIIITSASIERSDVADSEAGFQAFFHAMDLTISRIGCRRETERERKVEYLYYFIIFPFRNSAKSAKFPAHIT